MDRARHLIVAAVLLLVANVAHASCTPQTYATTNAVSCAVEFEASAIIGTAAQAQQSKEAPGRTCAVSGTVTHNSALKRYSVAIQCKTAQGAVASNTSYSATYAAATVCDANAPATFGSVSGNETTACVAGCEMKCTHAPAGCAGLDLNDGNGMLTYGDWKQTGATCGGQLDDPPDTEVCMDIRDTGFQYCTHDPLGCVRSPTGALLCPNVPGPDCATAPSGAACSNQTPPDGYGPPSPPITVCNGGSCTPITVAPPEDDDDEECDPETEDCPEEPQCPADDPDCEEDDECPEGFEGTPPFCEKEDDDGICTEDNQTVCDILKEIREATQGTEANTALQLKEDRETNFKLKVIGENAHTDALNIEGATNRVQVAADATRNAVNIAATNTTNAIYSAASTTNANVAATTAAVNALSGKLDGIKGAVDGASACGGVGEPTCSTGGGDEGVPGDGNGNGQPDWTEIGPQDAGQGVTPEDIAATGVRSISVDAEDLDVSGFGLGSSCPAMPSTHVYGVDMFQGTEFLCDWAEMLRAALLLFGAFWAIQILLGR